MRTGIWNVAFLCGALALGGCGPHKTASNLPATPKAKPPATPTATHDDLSDAANAKYLADNAAKPGVVKLPDGLQYRVIQTGSGKSPRDPNDVVTVTYKGWLIDGKVFDQTPAGKTASFPAGRLIPGWVEALSLMKAGDEWELVIPSDLGYGADGAGNVIPPNQTLVFDMKLVSVAPAR